MYSSFTLDLAFKSVLVPPNCKFASLFFHHSLKFHATCHKFIDCISVAGFISKVHFALMLVRETSSGNFWSI